MANSFDSAAAISDNYVSENAGDAENDEDRLTELRGKPGWYKRSRDGANKIGAAKMVQGKPSMVQEELRWYNDNRNGARDAGLVQENLGWYRENWDGTKKTGTIQRRLQMRPGKHT